MTTAEARTLAALVRLAPHAILRAACRALGHHREPTTVDALTRCRYCRTLWIETLGVSDVQSP